MAEGEAPFGRGIYTYSIHKKFWHFFGTVLVLLMCGYSRPQLERARRVRFGLLRCSPILVQPDGPVTVVAEGEHFCLLFPGCIHRWGVRGGASYLAALARPLIV